MKLTIVKRDGSTKSENTTIRRNEDIPAVVYGLGQDNEKIIVTGTEFQGILRSLKKGRLATTLFELHNDGNVRQAIIKDIQYHPVTYAIQHIDFFLVSSEVLVTVKVPVYITGAADCPGIKLGGTLRQVIRSLKVSCLLKDLPSEFQIDVRDLSVSQSKTLSSIELPLNVKALAALSEVAVVITKGKSAAA